MKRLGFVLALLLTVALAGSCRLRKDKQQFEEVASRYFDTVKRQEFDKVDSFFTPEFFKSSEITRDESLQIMHNMNRRLGDLTQYELVSWQGQEYVGTAKPSGTYFTLTFRTTYTKYIGPKLRVSPVCQDEVRRCLAACNNGSKVSFKSVRDASMTALDS